MRHILFVLMCVGLAVAPARADVFTVVGVQVDSSAASSSEAREIAIVQAQQIAATRLVERLTLPEDRGFLPYLDADTASFMVAGFEVEEEQVSGQRYIARITVAFDPGQVRNYLRSAGVPYVETRTRPVVVVPMWTEGSQVRLWEANPWLDAWRFVDQSAELVPIVAPSGDLQDFSTLNTTQAINMNAEALRALAARYGAERVLVTRARGVDAGASADLIEIDFTGGRATSQSLGAVGPDLMNNLVPAASGRLQESWKRRAVVRDVTQQTIDVTVLYGDVYEWLRLQSALTGSSLVENPRLNSLARGGASMTITHIGAPEQLVAELAELGVRLEQTPDAGWVARASALVGGFNAGR